MFLISFLIWFTHMPKQFFSKELRRGLVDHFEKKDAAREKLNRITRKIIRNCGEIIRNVHSNKEDAKLLKETGKLVKDVKAISKGHDDLFHSGMVENAFQEYAEACVLIAVLGGRKVPTPRSLGVTESAYMLGLGDVIGELRREALLDLRRHDVRKASGYVVQQDEFNTVTFDAVKTSALRLEVQCQDTPRRYAMGICEWQIQ